MVHLVDDEEVVRDALAWLLRSRRLLSEGFASAEAFEASGWRSRRPGPRTFVPAAGRALPGTSGLVLFDRLVERGLAPVLPVIFLTGHGDVPTAVAAVKRGAFDFVEKPFPTTRSSTASSRRWRPAPPSCCAGAAQRRQCSARWPT